MKAKYSPLVQKELIKIYKNDPKLSDRIEKQIALFRENPRHPSLRTHKLSGIFKNMWSISISKSIRMIYLLLDDGSALFINIGTHKEVYGK